MQSEWNMAKIVNKYPVGIQTFSKIREKGYLYIDKTQYIADFREKQMSYVFLSRPRRFGKSLFASTLQAYFEGRKELFEGLAIADYEKDWVKHPVLHFDLSGAKHMGVEQLERYLADMLEEQEAHWGYKTHQVDANLRLKDLVKKAYEQTGEKVVVIIDEYDAPLLDVVHEKENLQQLRRIMQNFYSPLKMLDPYLEFCFITGITKFSQLSIFSELNNLDNISMFDQYSAICGISKTELTTQMKPDVEALGEALDMTYEECLAELTRFYDGYHFSEKSEDVFNPFSLVKALNARKIAPYWFGSGTPSFLLKLLDKYHVNLASLEGQEAVLSSFDQSTEEMTDALPLLYQSGYLTIKRYDPLTNGYYLGIPNKEVKGGLMENLLPLYTNLSDGTSLGFAAKFYQALVYGDIDKAMTLMRSYFASIPYPEGGKDVLADMQKNEYYYETVFYIMLSMMNIAVLTQVKSCRGRADAVMFSPSTIFVFEIKINKSAQEALAQIDDKGYMVPFEADGRKLVKIGINFSTTTRTIEDWEYRIQTNDSTTPIPPVGLKS